MVAVPSGEVRRFLESEHARRATSPLHPCEREDAPPSVRSDLWRDLVDVARGLGITTTGAGYDPFVYRRVYEMILRDRNGDVVALDVILPTASLSVYDFAVAPPDLIPTEAEAEEFIREVERRYPDPTVLEREIAHWWEV